MSYSTQWYVVRIRIEFLIVRSIIVDQCSGLQYIDFMQFFYKKLLLFCSIVDPTIFAIYVTYLLINSCLNSSVIIEWMKHKNARQKMQYEHDLNMRNLDILEKHAPAFKVDRLENILNK